MTKEEKTEFLALIKEGALQALGSSQGQDAIVGALKSQQGQDAIVGALKSQQGQDAIVGALKSQQGQDAIIGALSTTKAKEFLLEFFNEAFSDILLPGIEKLQEDIDQLKSDTSDLTIDVNYLKSTAAKRDQFIQDIKEKILRKSV